MSKPELVLVRHGETPWSLGGRHTGRTDVALTENGRAAARRLGPLLAARRFVLVLTSPLSRASETCQLAGYGMSAQACDDLVEWDYGDYEGATTDDIRRDVEGWTIWTHSIPGGETADDVGRRADRVIERARMANGDVVLFGHGHLLRVLAARWCGLAAENGRLLALDATAVSVLGFEHETKVIRSWNQTRLPATH